MLSRNTDFRLSSRMVSRISAALAAALLSIGFDAPTAARATRCPPAALLHLQ